MVAEALEEEKVDDVEEEPTAPAVPVPQLKVGPDGQIILDPQSLVRMSVETSSLYSWQNHLSELVNFLSHILVDSFFSWKSSRSYSSNINNTSV